MNRRSALRSAGSLLGAGSLVGCLGTGNGIETAGNDDTPIDADPEDLLLSSERLHGPLREGWSEGDPEDTSLVRTADAANRWIPFDEGTETFHQESGTVTSGCWILEDVEAAREEFENSQYQEGWGYDEQPIGVESIGGIADGRAELRALFRDANAIGALQYENPHVGTADRETTGLELAAVMHRSWRDD